MIVLRALNLHWLDSGDSRDDQCAHGNAEFEVDGLHFVSPADRSFTLSAAALFLLRTLEQDHTAEAPVSEGNQLFPCCGFSVWPFSKRFPVLVLGCPNGIDIEVRHYGSEVSFERAGVKASAPFREWSSAVLTFASTVDEFYHQSPPRNPVLDPKDAEGWAAFWSEWKQRIEVSGSTISAP